VDSRNRRGDILNFTLRQLLTLHHIPLQPPFELEKQQDERRLHDHDGPPDEVAVVVRLLGDARAFQLLLSRTRSDGAQSEVGQFGRSVRTSDNVALVI
jgi:hypothetical protein